jgi:tetratricopeptide (TPR) repeat protein
MSTTAPNAEAPFTAETVKLDHVALAGIAESLLEQQRATEAAEIYARLASNDRTRKDYAARAHYAKAMMFLDTHARAEAREELRQALQLDPTLEPARFALDSMETTRIRQLTPP